MARPHRRLQQRDMLEMSFRTNKKVKMCRSSSSGSAVSKSWMAAGLLDRVKVFLNGFVAADRAVEKRAMLPLATMQGKMARSKRRVAEPVGYDVFDDCWERRASTILFQKTPSFFTHRAKRSSTAKCRHDMIAGQKPGATE